MTILIILLCLIFLSALFYGLYRWRLSLKGIHFFKAMRDQMTGDHQLEVIALQEKMKEAIDVMGHGALYMLPWFMMIGPSAAGKSTLLRHSGLHFPYQRHKDLDIKGFAGTRNCDWWFADEGVILDTAGRYTTDDEDKPEWIAFLDLLKTFRRKAPIHGVIVALSLSELLSANQSEREDHVHIIRAKLNELIERLGVLFPVYIVLTKCDFLTGFQEYVEDLSPENRAQIWGFPLGESFPSMSEALQRLYEKLCALRIQKLSLTVDVEARVKILGFPHEFKKATDRLIPFLNLLLKDNLYQEQPDFKGVYFTSGQQDNSDRTSYFVKNLFSHMILKNKTVIRSQYAKQVNKLLKASAVAFSAIGFLGVVALLQSSYHIHKGVYSKVNMILNDHANTVSGKDRQNSKAINILYDEYIRLDELIKHKPLSLYVIQKIDSGKNRVMNEWMSQMHDFFLKDVTQYLELDLINQSYAWPHLTDEQKNAVYGSFYDHLKTYLMLGDPVNLLERKYIHDRLTKHWLFVFNHVHRGLSLSNEKMQQMLMTYVDVIASGKYQTYVWKGNPDVIEEARRLLATSPSPGNVFRHFIENLHAEMGEVTLSKLLKGQSSHFFETQASISKVYTREGLYQKVLPTLRDAVNLALKGDWVLGQQDSHFSQQDEKKFLQQVRSYYFQQYAQSWFDFLASIHIKPFKSVEDAAHKLSLLQQQEGPLSELMRVIHDNVFISEVEFMPSQLSEKIKNIDLVPELDASFYVLRRLTQPGEKMHVSESIHQYMHLLNKIQSDLTRLAHASNIGRDAEQYAQRVYLGSDTELSQAVASLSFLLETATTGAEAATEGDKTRQAIEPMLLSAFVNVWEVVLQSAGTYLQEAWSSQVIDTYNHTIRHKFPFSKTAVEATLEDVETFFRPGEGVLSAFQDRDLKPYLEWARNGYVPLTWLSKGINFSDDFIQSLNSAKRISEGMFKSSGSEVSLVFYVSPVPVPGVEEAILDVNGQVYRYRNEPEEWRRFEWPGRSADMGARVVASHNHQSEWGEIYRPGVWGLFHLLKSASLTREGGAQYLAQWRVKYGEGESMNVKYKLRADKQHNVFEPGLLQSFELPEKIIKENTYVSVSLFKEQ